MLRIARRLRVAAVLTVSCAAGCITPPSHPYAIAPGYEGAAETESFLLLPLNVVVDLPDELQRPAPHVSELMTEHLEACGKQVSSIGLYAAREFWRAATRDVEKSDDAERNFAAAAPIFAKRLREQERFDALVIASLVYREARIVEGSRAVIWDGVKRELEIANEPHMHGSIYLMGTPSGAMPAVSLHVLVFDGEGRPLFESYGGLDLVHKFDLTGPVADKRPFAMPFKSHRLANDAFLREGIGLAFEPFLPLLPDPGADGS